MTLTQQIITIAMCVLGTMATRFLPFIIFNEKRRTPEFVQYLGKFLRRNKRGAGLFKLAAFGDGVFRDKIALLFPVHCGNYFLILTNKPVHSHALIGSIPL